MAAKRRSQAISATDGKRRRLITHFSCEICDSTFNTLRDIKNHRKDKHDGNQWKCNICDLEMKFSRSLNVPGISVEKTRLKTEL